MSCVVAALYKFVALPDYRDLREPLLDRCLHEGLRGTLLLAEEGINGTVSGSRSGLDRVLAWLRSDPRFADLEHKESLHEEQPFLRMKVKLKREIVTMGVPQVDPKRRVGSYVRASGLERAARRPGAYAAGYTQRLRVRYRQLSRCARPGH